MRIVNRETFLKMPEGTVYALYDPCILDGLYIKGETTGEDWFETCLTTEVDCRSSDEEADMLMDSHKNGTEIPMDFDTICRNGAFEFDQLFAVWNQTDVLNLIIRLQRTCAPKLMRIDPTPVMCPKCKINPAPPDSDDGRCRNCQE